MPQKSATDYYNLGIGYIDTAETDKTIYDAPGEALQDLIPLELPPKNLDENPELEKHALSWGYFIRAIECFEKAIELNPDYADAYHSLGYAHHKTIDFTKAIDCFEKAIELNPDNPRTYYRLGNSYVIRHHYPKAIECFEKAIELHPDFAKAYNNLGYVYLGFESPWYDSDLGIECYKKAAKLGYKGAQIWLEKNGYDW